MQRLLLPFKEFRLAAHKRKTTYTGKHTQSGMCTAKSAYNTLAISYAQLHPPPTIPTQTIDILKQVWKDKSMRPRIKTFAWRILEGPDRRPEGGGGLNGSLKFDPKIEEKKVPIQTPHHCS